MYKAPIITIDGPSGTGKGTITHMLANHLHWNVLDSGSLYRVLAYAALDKSINTDDIQSLTDLALKLDIEFRTDSDGGIKIHFENQDITTSIRSEQCGQTASIIAVYPSVREALLEKQRNFAIQPGLVTDGRDMGTVVFPNADLKLYLYASTEARAERRYNQLKATGINVSLTQVVEELVKRDERDSQRQTAPLKAASDAISIDTTGLSVSEVFDIALTYVMSKGLVTDEKGKS